MIRNTQNVQSFNERTDRRNRALLIGSAVLTSILSIWASSGFTREPPPASPQPPGMTIGDDHVTLTPDTPQWKVLKLSPVTPATMHWTDAMPARVRIDETRASKIGSPLGGRVTSVYVELGQSVKAGDPLFSVASSDIAGLRAERDKAAVDVEVAKTSLERIRAMVEARAVAAKDEVEANQQFRQAQVSLRLAQSKLASLKVSPRADNEFTVMAPQAGVVVEKNIHPAQQVTQDGVLIAVADLSSIWIVADLFESDAAGIVSGTKAQMTSPSLPGFSSEADVQMISSVVDPVRHTVSVRVELPNPEGILRPNIFAQMRFAVEPAEGLVEIPASALISDGSHQYVYIQNSAGRFSRREIVAGSAREGKIPVSRGLQAGDIVVEQGGILLDNQIDMSR